MHGRRYYLPGDLELSMEAQDVLCRVFRPDPKKRIGLAQLRRHPWLTRSASIDLASSAHQPLSAFK